LYIITLFHATNYARMMFKPTGIDRQKRGKGRQRERGNTCYSLSLCKLIGSLCWWQTMQKSA